jgi:hypothetical protein
VAGTDTIDTVLRGREAIFGRKVSLPPEAPVFDFAIPDDGSLPLDGAAPSLIDRRGRPRSMAMIADLGARLVSFTLDHPGAAAIAALHHDLAAEGGPAVVAGPAMRYEAVIDTPGGLRRLT